MTFVLAMRRRHSGADEAVAAAAAAAQRYQPMSDVLRRRAVGGYATARAGAAACARAAEALLVRTPRWTSVVLPPTTRSTISLSFSPGGRMFASTHGDHTVKIISSDTRQVLRELVGHPRTPWTVKFHPTNPNVVASGCLDGRVYIWDVPSATICYRLAQDKPIISLDFHPTENVVGIASGRKFVLWRYESNATRTILEVPTSLRAVMFPKKGTSVILGVANKQSQVPEELANQSEHLSMKQTMAIVEYPLNLEALKYRPAWAPGGGAGAVGTTGIGAEARARGAAETRVGTGAAAAAPVPGGAGAMAILVDLSNPKIIVKHAVLYNDGGMDISHEGGRFVCCMYQEPKAQEPPSAASSRRCRKGGAVDSPCSTALHFGTGTDSVGKRNRNSSARRGNVVKPGAKRWSSRHLHSSSSNELESSGLSGAPRSSGSSASSASSESSWESSSLPMSGARGAAGSPGRRRARSPGRSSQAGPAKAPPLDLRRRRVRRRTEEPLAGPLFQLAIVGLEDHNFGDVLAYKTIKWATAKGTTSVKFSPSSEHVLVGYGVRTGAERAGQTLVVAMFRSNLRTRTIDMVQGVKSQEDDLNIALFHPRIGFIYGTKRGCIRCVDVERRTKNDPSLQVRPGPYSFQIGGRRSFRLMGSLVGKESGT